MSTTLKVSNASSNQNNMPCQIRDNRALDISVIVFFCAILLSSLIGNTVIIIIFYRRKDLKKTTNYFIANMAISDLIFPLTPIPLSIIGLQTLPVSVSAGSIVCKLQIFLGGVSLTVSVESLVWIAVDRFIAVVFPIKVHRISTRFRRFAVTSTWIVAVLICSVHLYTVEAMEGVSLTVSIESLVCISMDRFVAVVFPLKAHLITARVRTAAITFTWFIAVFLNSVEFYMPVCAYKNTSTFYVDFGRGRTTFLFTVPLIIIAISYCAIAITLRKHDRALQCGNQSNQRKRQAIKMSFCVMLSFYFLILPLTIVANLLPDRKVFKSCSVLQNIWLLVQLALYTSSTVNPIICIAFVQSFRRGLTEILPCYYSKNLKVEERRKSNQQEIRLERF
ncbi:QRFP-like peptide receptor [Porites lutea]|uniref:QRFP-like peptide receptor n=1 Tax=Porites lutea TaxID=51062 RepID=UPI003CC5EFFD